MAENMINKMKEKGEYHKNRLLEWIDRVLEDKEVVEVEERSIKDTYEKIKNYFKDLKIEMKEKFAKFGEWAKNKFETGLEKGKDKYDNLKQLAKEVSIILKYIIKFCFHK